MFCTLRKPFPLPFPINHTLYQKNMLQYPHPPATTTNENSDHPPTFHDMYSGEFDIDSNCSTPFVSAPSSPGRSPPPQIGGFYYSAPTSPVHFILSSSVQNNKNPSVSTHSEASPASSTCSFEFDFSARLTTNGPASPGSISTMTSADELFLNGQIRPMKLSDVLDDDPVDVDEITRGRAAKFRDRSGRRTRSMSPLRTMSFEWGDDFGEKIVEENEKNQKMEKMSSRKLKVDGIENIDNEGLDLDIKSTTTPNQCESGSSSRSSSVGRSSKKWVFLKEFLYRSKSEGRDNGHKFWGSLSFSPAKDKIKTEKFLASRTPSNVSSSKDKISTSSESVTSSSVSEGKKGKQSSSGKDTNKKTTAAAVNGVGKRRVPPSAHELHYTANRAQAEEMRKKTFLPYRQGLLGCLGFSSKSYGAMNGFARALNPVSSS